jgi:nucleotide-binding universal stress UspA family protein
VQLDEVEVRMPNPQITVALKEAVSVDSLITLACQMAASMKADVTALHVVEVPAATPIEAQEEVIDHEGKEILAEAEKRAETGFARKISVELLRARNAGEAIVGEAGERGVNLLILGQGTLLSLGEFLVGSTARHVGRHAPCRVLVEIQPHHRS